MRSLTSLANKEEWYNDIFEGSSGFIFCLGINDSYIIYHLFDIAACLKAVYVYKTWIMSLNRWSTLLQVDCAIMVFFCDSKLTARCIRDHLSGNTFTITRQRKRIKTEIEYYMIYFRFVGRLILPYIATAIWWFWKLKFECYGYSNWIISWMFYESSFNVMQIPQIIHMWMICGITKWMGFMYPFQ